MSAVYVCMFLCLYVYVCIFLCLYVCMHAFLHVLCVHAPLSSPRFPPSLSVRFVFLCVELTLESAIMVWETRFGATCACGLPLNASGSSTVFVVSDQHHIILFNLNVCMYTRICAMCVFLSPSCRRCIWRPLIATVDQLCHHDCLQTKTKTHKN